MMSSTWTINWSTISLLLSVINSLKMMTSKEELFLRSKKPSSDGTAINQTKERRPRKPDALRITIIPFSVYLNPMSFLIQNYFNTCLFSCVSLNIISFLSRESERGMQYNCLLCSSFLFCSGTVVASQVNRYRKKLRSTKQPSPSRHRFGTEDVQDSDTVFSFFERRLSDTHTAWKHTESQTGTRSRRVGERESNCKK